MGNYLVNPSTGVSAPITFAGNLVVAGHPYGGSNVMTPGVQILTGPPDGPLALITSKAAGSERALSVAIIDSGGNQISSFGGSGGTSVSDNGTFTTGTTAITPVGGLYTTVARSVTSGRAAILAMSQYGCMHTTPRDGAGVSMTDDTNHALKVNMIAGTATITGSVTMAGATLKGATVGATVAADASVTTVDSNTQALDVFIRGGGGTGGTALADKAAFTEGTTSVTPVAGVFNDAITADPTEDHAAALRMTAKRALHANLRDVAGVELGTAGNPIRVDPSGTTAQPVRMVASAANGCSIYSIASASGTNASSVKASPGTVKGAAVFNINAAPAFVKLYDATAAPTAGSGTPRFVIGIPGNTALGGAAVGVPPEGVSFPTGIGFTIVTGLAPASATGVAANEVLVNLFYQ